MPTTAAISVSQLNRRAKTLLEQGIARLWIEGEISNLSRPASGHVYLTLKDDAAQVSAAWFRQRQRGPAHRFKDGDQVLVYGRVTLYEARGNFQVIIEEIEPAGEGVLKRRFDALKKKLGEEGLFDEDRKRPLPLLPRRVGIITSPTGAALRDILTVMRRRFPSVPVVIYPAAVQGDAAPAELLDALASANARRECDVLIIGRGGGSLEDLWAFNDEALARAIAASELPVVSAVGHEVDFTIADFVADLRAPTPSGAAELVLPDRRDWQRRVAVLASRLARIAERRVGDPAQALDWLRGRLLQSSPAATLARQRASLAELKRRAAAAIRRRLLQQASDLQAHNGRLRARSPAAGVQRRIGRLQALSARLSGVTVRRLADSAHRLALLGRALDGVSPLATLDRGYAIVQRGDDGRVLHRAGEVRVGDPIRARLASGTLLATVAEVLDDDA